MPLHILLPMVVTGIPLIVLLIWWLQPSPRADLTPEYVAMIWNRRHPEAPFESAEISSTRDFAIVETTAGKGIFWMMGIDPVTRMLSPDWEAREDTSGLTLIPHDFATPRIRLAIPNEIERKTFRAALKGAHT